MALGALATARDEPWTRRSVAVEAGPELPPGPLQVLDGDTFVLADGRRVRLAGVDTPEVGRPLADRATAFAARHLEGRQLRLEPPEPPTDRYGRLLADVLADGESLSAALLAEGLAWVYRSDRPDLLAAQRRAVAGRRGLHAEPPDGRWVVTASRFHDGACRIVRGRAQQLPVSALAAELFAAGRSPCRLCLAWPPPASWRW